MEQSDYATVYLRGRTMIESRSSMIVKSLRQHWPSRKMEWIGAGFLMSWGVYVLLHPELFTQPGTVMVFAGLASISAYMTDYPALLWGGIAFAAGMIRAIALFINGAYVRTPMIRVLVSFVSMFILTQIFYGMWKSGVPNTGLVVYPWMILADMLSAHRASIDAVHATKHSQDMKDAYSSLRAPTGLVAS